MALEGQLRLVLCAVLVACGPAGVSATPPTDAKRVLSLPPASSEPLAVAEASEGEISLLPRPEVPCAGQEPRSVCGETVRGQVAEVSTARIDRLQKAMTDTGFKDAAIMSELARLLLVRDEETPHNDGGTDAERARKNAMRAVAVDPSDEEAQFVLSLSLMRSFQERPPTSTEQRTVMMDLLEARLSSGGSLGGPLGAARQALLGQVALERGDAGNATLAFQAAIALDSKLACAHNGLGDAARSTGNFSESMIAYRRALALDLRDAGALRSLAAAERGERLQTAASSPAAMRLGNGPISGPPPSVKRCPPAAEVAVESKEFCAAVALLAGVNGAAARTAAADGVLRAFGEADSCEKAKANCGDFTARGLLDAAQAYASSGAAGKAITVARMVSNKDRGLAANDLLTIEASLLAGDGYFALTVYDKAAEFYAQAFAVAGASARAAGERALALDLLLGRDDRVVKTSRSLGRLSGLNSGEVRAFEGLAQKSGKPPAITSPCGLIFGCIGRRLAADARWSRSFAR